MVVWAVLFLLLERNEKWNVSKGCSILCFVPGPPAVLCIAELLREFYAASG